MKLISFKSIIRVILVSLAVLAFEVHVYSQCPTSCDATVTITPGTPSSSLAVSAGCSVAGQNCAGFIIDATSDPSVNSITFSAGNGGSCGAGGVGSVRLLKNGSCSILSATNISGYTESLSPTVRTFTVYVCRSSGAGSLNLCTISFNSSCSVTAAIVSGTQTICSGATPTTLYGNGTNGSTAPSGTATLSHQWQSSTTSCSAGFSNISGAIALTHSPGALTTTTNYRLITTSTAGCADTSNCITVMVNPNPTVSITGSNSICAGMTTTLSPTTGGTWVSSNTSVATVTNGGVVTGVSAGSATFTFTNTTTNCSASTSAVTIKALPTVSITGSNSICAGATTTLSPITGGTWVSSNSSVATVTNEGVVTGVSAGSATFTFTNITTNCSATTSAITIKSPTSSTLSQNSCEGDTIIFFGQNITTNGSYMHTITNGNNMGCDSTITLNATFYPKYNQNVNYTGCSGDGYSIVVNGTTYNEGNPSGTESMMSSQGCDSTININLTFNPQVIVEAGMPSGPICSNAVVDLTSLGASISGGVSTGQWTTMGNGSFNNGGLFQSIGGSTTYTLGQMDKDAGMVILTLTSNDPAGPCEPDADAVMILINNITCSPFPWAGN